MSLTCKDCDAPYGKDGWVDVVIPDETWNKICPEDGVLCFRCMTKRIEKAGIDGVPVIISSGPYRDANEEWRMVGWNHGHKVGRAEMEEELDRLREALGLLINFIPEGWPMPFGWNQVVAQARKAMEGRDGQ